MAKRIFWSCANCGKKAVMDYLAQDNVYYIGYLAYCDHNKRSENCQAVPTNFEIWVEEIGENCIKINEANDQGWAKNWYHIVDCEICLDTMRGVKCCEEETGVDHGGESGNP